MTDARRYIRPINAGANLKPRDGWPRFNGRGPGHVGGWRAADARPDESPPLGNRAVVLAGAEQGLGAALFAILHAQGARLLALDRAFNPDQRRTADALCEPARVVLRYTNLSDPTALPSAGELTTFLGPDPGTGTGSEAVLLHTAAASTVLGPIDPRDIDAVGVAVHVNLVAPICLTNLFMSAVPDHYDRVRLVYVTSGAADQSEPGWAAHQAAESAIETFLRVVRRSAGPRCTVDVIRAADIVGGVLGRARSRFTDNPGPHTVAARIVSQLFAATG
jgi:benzil reductase ((S)-benzoin forming)